MKNSKVFVIFAVICAAAVFIHPQKAASAQDAANPALTLSVNLQQAKIRLNEPVKGSITISNATDEKVDSANLVIALPDAIRLYEADCTTQMDPAAFNISEFKGRKVMRWEVCYKLDSMQAHAGSYTIIYTLNYSWGENEAISTVEKAVEIDLIGVQSVFGVPLAFAGFVLPGLMILIMLKMFKAPWAVNQTSEERIIIGVLLSVLLMWAITAYAGQRTDVQWLQKFNLYEEVSLEKLILYIVSGIVVGLIFVILYKGIVLLVNYLQKNKLITIYDSNKKIVKKALSLNTAYVRGTVVFFHKKENYRILGTHFVSVDANYLVFPQFRFTSSKLKDAELKAKVDLYLDRNQDGEGIFTKICTDRKIIIELMDMIMEDSGDSFEINKPVSIISAGTLKEEPLKYRRFYEIKKDDFSVMILDEKEFPIISITH